jgi:tetratricopeptide (TPR) repeat protein
MLKSVQEATKREPGLSELHRKLAMVYRAEGKFDKAITELNAAIKVTDDEYGDYFLEASVYETAGQSGKATAARQQAHSAIAAEMKKEAIKDPIIDEFSNPDVLFVFDGDDEVRSAPGVIALLEPQSTVGKIKPMERLMLGKAYCAVGRISDCKREEEEAFHLESKLINGTSEHALGLALLGKDNTGAIDHFQRAYELDPQNVTYRMDYEQVSNQTHRP